MIESIHLTNIKKHKDLTLNFIQGINRIVGDTDTGKTGMLKGLLWNLLNDGTGEKLINNQGAKACSAVTVINGHTLERSWSKTANEYFLDGNRFGTFRTGVPVDIQKLVNMDNINIQKRRDPPFMIYWKASENAEQFSTMLDISEINVSVTNINKIVKDAKDECEKLDVELVAISVELDKSSGIEEAYEQLSILLKRRDDSKLAHSRLELLTTLGRNACTAHAEAKTLRSVVDAQQELEKIETRRVQVSNVRTKLQELEKVSYSYSDAFKLANHYASAIEMETTLRGVEEKHNSLFDLKTRLSGMKAMATSLSDAECRVTILSSVVEADSQLTAIQKKRQALGLKQETLAGLLSLQKTQVALETAVSKWTSVKDAIQTLSSLESRREALLALKEKVSLLRSIKQAHQTAEAMKDEAEKAYETANKLYKENMPEVCPLCGSKVGDCND